MGKLQPMIPTNHSLLWYCHSSITSSRSSLWPSDFNRLSLDLGHPRLESRDAKFASARISISEFVKESRIFAMTDRKKTPPLLNPLRNAFKHLPYHNGLHFQPSVYNFHPFFYFDFCKCNFIFSITDSSLNLQLSDAHHSLSNDVIYTIVSSIILLSINSVGSNRVYVTDDSD